MYRPFTSGHEDRTRSFQERYQSISNLPNGVRTLSLSLLMRRLPWSPSKPISLRSPSRRMRGLLRESSAGLASGAGAGVAAGGAWVARAGGGVGAGAGLGIAVRPGVGPEGEASTVVGAGGA